MPGWLNIQKSINVSHHINRLKEKLHDNISKWIKMLDSSILICDKDSVNRIEGAFHHMKNVYKNPTTNIIFNV